MYRTIEKSLYKQRRVILMLFLVMLNILGWGQSMPTLEAQSPRIQDAPNLRVPSEKRMTSYRDDARFQYDESKPKYDLSFFEKLLNRLNRYFNNISTRIENTGIYGIIVIVVAVLIIILIIFKVSGIKFRSVFGKKKLETDPIEIYTEDVHKIDFQSQLANAIKNKDFRLAVRLLYLRNLKALADKEFIKWNPNKTNYSYQYEISNQTVRSQFLETTFIFDYIWYGEFALNEQQYDDIYHRMEKFNQLIADER